MFIEIKVVQNPLCARAKNAKPNETSHKGPLSPPSRGGARGREGARAAPGY